MKTLSDPSPSPMPVAWSSLPTGELWTRNDWKLKFQSVCWGESLPSRDSSSSTSALAMGKLESGASTSRMHLCLPARAKTAQCRLEGSKLQNVSFCAPSPACLRLASLRFACLQSNPPFRASRSHEFRKLMEIATHKQEASLSSMFWNLHRAYCPLLYSSIEKPTCSTLSKICKTP